MKNFFTLIFILSAFALTLVVAPAINFSQDYPEEIISIDYRPFVNFPAKAASVSTGADFESITIPLKRAGNLILLEAIVDSLPGNLILDTGSSALVLNSIYFRRDRRSGSFVAGGVTGEARTVSRAKISEMQISELRFKEINANVTDLGHIEKAKNTRILGFFGLSVFADFEVVIDLNNSILELHRLDHRGNRIAKTNTSKKPDLSIPVINEKDVLFLNAWIGGRKLTLCLDTGAESNVLGGHLPNRVLNTVSIHRRANLRGVGSQSIEVLYGSMNEFNIGGSEIAGMNTIISNLSAMSDAYGVRIDGMLGCDFLEKGIFIINLKQKNIAITFYKEEKK